MLDNKYELFEVAKRENNLEWFNWKLVQILNIEQKIRYAIFAAKSVIGIYEEEYPSDNRLKRAIESAERYLENKTEENRQLAHDAFIDVTAASYTAIIAAAVGAAAVVSCISRLSTYSYTNIGEDDISDHVADIVANASYVASAARNAASDAGQKQMTKIIEYGLSLLE